MLAEGRYPARAAEWQLGFAGNGTEQVAVVFRLLEEEHQGRTITWFGFLTPDAAELTIKALITCGWTGLDMSDLSGLDTNDVELVVEHETYQGKTSAKVRWINRPGSGGIRKENQMNEVQRRALAQKMRGLIVAVRKQEGAPTRASQPPASPPQNRRPPQRNAGPQDPGGYPPEWDQQAPPDL